MRNARFTQNRPLLPVGLGSALPVEGNAWKPGAPIVGHTVHVGAVGYLHGYVIGEDSQGCVGRGKARGKLHIQPHHVHERPDGVIDLRLVVDQTVAAV